MATILVAEDEVELRERLRTELADRGYQVVTATDGREALAALGAFELDLVLADTRIPGIDATQVRAWKELAPDTEVVVATGNDELAGALDCIHGGAFDYVERPFAIPTLVATLERALERRQLRAASSLYETSRAILATHEPERLPEVIVRVAMKALNADDVALLVPGHDGALFVACSTALNSSLRADVHESLDELTQELATTLREPVIMRRGIVSSCIFYPLATTDRLVGMLAISRVINSRAFISTDVDKAGVLAAQILLALENMRLLRHALANERLASVGQLVTSIAHEVNNPIAYVLASQTHIRDQLDHAIALCGRLAGGTEVLALRARLDEMRQPLDHVRDGAERVRDILRDTRALVQNQNTASSFDVGDPIRSALRVVAAELRHRTTVTTTLGDHLFVHGRPGQLAQVLANLLVHMAARFPGESAANAIVITSRLADGHVVVALRDNSPCITAEALPRLFDPFVTNSLAFAREIIRAHDGELTVEADDQGGSCYTIVLPLASPARGRTRTDSPVKGGARLRVLLVDDEPNILRTYKRTLGTDHDVVTAEHGEEALAAIRTHGDFDLVLCDVSMPTMSGMQLFAHVRELAPALAERFVFATGGATQRSIEQFLASVPNLVLEKPFDMRMLRQLVADLQRRS